jgi:DNA-binding NarL/FixJ family response regulator
VAEKTVNNHRANIRDKLHVRDVAGLTRYAISQGMIEAGLVGK